MIELIGAPGSAYVRKVRIMLVEKNIGFKSTYLCPMLPLPEWFKAQSPLGKIPVLRDDDFSISDSSAICHYLEAKYPQQALYPKDPQHLAKALWLEEYADTSLFQALAPFYYQTILLPLIRQQKPNLQAIETAASNTLPKAAKYLTSLLEKNQHPTYLVNNHFSIADISIASVFFNMYQAGYPLDQETWPALDNYLQSIFQRPSFIDCIQDINEEKESISTNLQTSFAEV